MKHRRALHAPHGVTKRRKVTLAYLVVTALSLAIAVPAAVGSSPDRVPLQFSLSADRTTPKPLDDGVLQPGNVYVFAYVPGAAEVRFWIDRPISGTPDQTVVALDQSKAPFDLMGGTPDAARPWDLTKLSPGEHEVTAVAMFGSGFSGSTTTEFTVAEPAPTPPKTSPTTTAPKPESTGTSSTSGGSTQQSTTTSPTNQPPAANTTTSTSTSGSCASNTLPDPLADYPGPQTAGVPGSAVLTRIDGDFHTSSDGQVISNLEIMGKLYIDHSNVTVKCSRIWGTTSNTHANLRMWLSTLGDPQGTREGSALKYSNYTLRRVEILGTFDGLKAEGNVDVRDTWIHDLYRTTDSTQSSGMTHNDCVQSIKGSHMVFQHNRFDTWSFTDGQVAGVNAGKTPYGDGAGYQTSAFMLNSGSGNISDVLIEDNLIRGRAAKYIFALSKAPYTTTGVRILNNVMGVENRDYPKWFGVNSVTTVAGNVAVTVN